MKITQKNKKDERRVLTAMVTNTKVLARVSHIWTEHGLLENKWSNLIGGWCVEFYHRFQQAPRERIEQKYERWAVRNKNEALAEFAAKYLSSLSEAYEQDERDQNSEYLIELASRYFNTVRLQRLNQRLTEELEGGNAAEADLLLKTDRSIDITSAAAVNILSDKNAIRAAFDSHSSTLIEYPDALGNFFQSTLERDAFVSFMAPEKRGKTWWLLDVVWRGVEQGRNVAFFQVGDLSQNQIARRILTRAVGRPLKPKVVQIPIEIILENTKKGSFAKVETRPKRYKQGLGGKEAWHHVREHCAGMASCLRLSTHPNSSLSVAGLRSILQDWEDQDGWVADVVVIDYADILAPPPGSGRADTRDQTNETWKQMRALSQERHCCVVTATQTKATSYGAGLLTREHFSEDKRKFAHVTAMVGINVSDFDKKMGITKLNWIVLRELEFDVSVPVWCAGCLDIANPAILSVFH